MTAMSCKPLSQMYLFSPKLRVPDFFLTLTNQVDVIKFKVDVDDIKSTYYPQTY